MATPVPSAIKTFVDATNSADPKLFLTAFAPDAALIDWGREFRGHDAIARWNANESMGVHMHIDLLGVTENGDHLDVEINATSDGPRGTETINMWVANDLISRVEIG
jgi:ketosteroid isomerase-like protein